MVGMTRTLIIYTTSTVKVFVRVITFVYLSFARVLASYQDCCTKEQQNKVIHFDFLAYHDVQLRFYLRHCWWVWFSIPVWGFFVNRDIGGVFRW